MASFRSRFSKIPKEYQAKSISTTALAAAATGASALQVSASVSSVSAENPRKSLIPLEYYVQTELGLEHLMDRNPTPEPGEGAKPRKPSKSKWSIFKKQSLSPSQSQAAPQPPLCTDFERNIRIWKWAQEASFSPPNATNVSLRFDSRCRSDVPQLATEPLDGKGDILWSRAREEAEGPSPAPSDTDPEIGEYIERRKKEQHQEGDGDQIPSSGAFNTKDMDNYWYDNENDVVRVLHKDSISLTSYGDPQVRADKQRLFGKSKEFYPDLTNEERAMLGDLSFINKTEASVPSPGLQTGPGLGFRRTRSCISLTVVGLEELDSNKTSIDLPPAHTFDCRYAQSECGPLEEYDGFEDAVEMQDEVTIATIDVHGKSRSRSRSRRRIKRGHRRHRLQDANASMKSYCVIA